MCFRTVRRVFRPLGRTCFSTGPIMRITEYLASRELLEATTSNEEVDEIGFAAQEGRVWEGVGGESGKPLSVYIGFDPTAPSLHLGSLTQLLTLVHLRRFGLRPIALLGSATGQVGDPSGRSEERVLLSEEVVGENSRRLGLQIEGFLKRTVLEEFGGKGVEEELILENGPFYSDMGALGFLRDVGKHVRMSSMLSRDSVRSRLDGDGLSFTEFAYQVLQAHDFCMLRRDYGCVIQCGGSDQWGNIVGGVDMSRKRGFGKVVGVTLPLVVGPDGKKLGKSAGNAVWLDETMTSDFAMYQYLVRTEDHLLPSLLRRLTLMEETEIQQALSTLQPQQLQQLLAQKVVQIARGTEAAQRAQHASDLLFGSTPVHTDSNQQPPSFLDQILRAAQDNIIPAIALPTQDALLTTSVLDLAVQGDLTKSRKDAKRLIKAGGLYLNNQRIADPNSLSQTPYLATNGSFLLLRAGSSKPLVIYTLENP